MFSVLALDAVLFADDFNINISQHCTLALLPSLPHLHLHTHTPRPPPPLKMSVTLQPSNSIGFNRASLASPSLFPLSRSSHPHLKGPLTQNVKRSLNITNPNADPVSFKIKTTAPKVRTSLVQVSLGSPIPKVVLRTTQLWKG